MPSSTSSFRQSPTGPAFRVWLVALLIAGTGIGMWEGLWRAAGHHVSVVDDRDLWCMQRGKVNPNDPNCIVLLGNSRMLVFPLGWFRDRYPQHTLAQLAIGGKDPLAGLRDLAEDPHFIGAIVCAVSERAFTPEQHDMSDYVDYFHDEWTLNKRANRILASSIQSSFVTRNPRLGLQNLLTELHLKSRLPRPHYAKKRSDRYTSLDFQEPGVVAQLRVDPDLDPRTLDDPPTLDHSHVDAEEWLTRASEFNRLARKIIERGGHVVFVVMPTSGHTREALERYYPRQTYWDRFEALTSAEFIHFEDLPEMATLSIPDTSHLDYRDAPRFAEALCKELAKRTCLNPKTTLP